MKKYFLILSFLLCAAFVFALTLASCKVQTENISNKLIYTTQNDLWIFGEKRKLPEGKIFLYDNKINDGWLVFCDENEFIFQNVFTRCVIRTIAYKEGTPRIPDYSEHFIFDNKAVIRENYSYGKCLSFYIVDLNSQTSKLYVFPDIKDCWIRGIGDGALALHNFDNKSDSLFYYEENRIEQIDCQLTRLQWFPVHNKFVGLNNKNEICIYDPSTKEIKSTKQKGASPKREFYLSTEYFLADNLLYYSKTDKGYIARHSYAYVFPIAWDKRLQTPKKWYCLDLETNKKTALELDGVFTKIIHIEK